MLNGIAFVRVVPVREWILGSAQVGVGWMGHAPLAVLGLDEIVGPLGDDKLDQLQGPEQRTRVVSRWQYHGHGVVEGRQPGYLPDEHGQ